MRKTLEERFWGRVQRLSDEECWPWKGGTTVGGYGVLGVWVIAEARWKTDGAHRVSYELHRGVAPEHMSVLHSCDNPPCVNPRHLFLGTTQDNVDDMIAKGRNSYGSKHNRSTVTEAGVLSMRSRWSAGESLYVLAREVGLSPRHVWDILTLKLWRHVGSCGLVVEDGMCLRGHKVHAEHLAGYVCSGCISEALSRPRPRVRPLYCRSGHPYDELNTGYNGRRFWCRECCKIASRTRRQLA